MLLTPFALNSSYFSIYAGSWLEQGGVNAPGTPIWGMYVISTSDLCEGERGGKGVLTMMLRPVSSLTKGSAVCASSRLSWISGSGVPGAIWALERMVAARECACLAVDARMEAIVNVSFGWLVGWLVAVMSGELNWDGEVIEWLYRIDVFDDVIHYAWAFTVRDRVG